MGYKLRFTVFLNLIVGLEAVILFFFFFSWVTQDLTDKTSLHLLLVSAWELSLGALVESLLVGTHDTVRQREFDVGVEELLDVGTQALGGLDLLHLNDVDATEASTVATGHLLVHAATASLDVRALNSLYMLVVPERES